MNHFDRGLIKRVGLLFLITVFILVIDIAVILTQTLKSQLTLAFDEFPFGAQVGTFPFSQNEPLFDGQTGTFPIEQEDFPFDGQTGTFPIDSLDIVPVGQADTFFISDSDLVPVDQVGTFPVAGEDIVPVGQIGTFPIEQPLPVCQESRRPFFQCGGTVGLEGFSPADTIEVVEITDLCNGISRFEVVNNLGNLGQCQAAQSVTQPPTIFTPAPQVIQQPQVVQQPQVIQQPRIVQQPQQIVTQPGVAAPPIIQAPPVNTIVQVDQDQRQNNSSNSSSNAQTGPITIQTPGGGGGGTVQIVPVASQPQIITVPQTVPQTVFQTVPQVIPASGVPIVEKELPKTGLPLAAWPLSGMLPLGFGLKRFGRDKQISQDPYYLWQKRKFLQDL